MKSAALLACLLALSIAAGCATGRPEGGGEGQGKAPAVPVQGAGTPVAQAQDAAPGAAKAPGGAATSAAQPAPGAAAGKAPAPYLLRSPEPPPPPPPETAEERRQRLEALWRRLGLEFARVPAGEFEVATRSGVKDPHVERVGEFFLARREVTVAQFRAFVEATGYRIAEGGHSCRQAQGSRPDAAGSASWRDPGFPQRDDHPVVCVSWNDAKAFCDWAGVRLPTETEWEYAAGNGARRSAYGWGDGAPAGRRSGNLAGEEARRVLGLSWGGQKVLSGHDDGYAHTAPVGSYEPNDFGLFDVTGNVMEWTSTSWQMGAGGGGNSPFTGTTYVLRGGAWESIAENSLVQSATSYYRQNRSNFIGFRVARDAP